MAKTKFTKEQMIKVAKLEIQEWRRLQDGIALAILFAFIHRLTTGERVEEILKKRQPEIDYEI